MRSGRGGEVLGSKHQTGAGDVAEKPADKKVFGRHYCQVNRQTFYYHFQDIYDLLRFFLDHETQVTVAGSANWQEALLRCFQYAREHHLIIFHVFRSNGRDYLDNHFFRLARAVSQGALRACSPDLTLEEPDLAFLSDFYMYALGGLIMGWLSDDMKEEPEALVERISRLLDGEFRRAAETFARRGPPAGTTF